MVKEMGVSNFLLIKMIGCHGILLSTDNIIKPDVLYTRANKFML